MMIDTQAAFELFAAIIRQAVIDAKNGDVDAAYWLDMVGIDRKRTIRPGQAIVMPALHPEREAKRRKRAIAKNRASQKPVETFLLSG
jgi:hypothetical protein